MEELDINFGGFIVREIFPIRQFYFSSSQKVPFIMRRITYCLSVCY